MGADKEAKDAVASGEDAGKEAKLRLKKERKRVHSQGYHAARAKARNEGKSEVSLFLGSLCDKVCFV